MTNKNDTTVTENSPAVDAELHNNAESENDKVPQIDNHSDTQESRYLCISPDHCIQYSSALTPSEVSALRISMQESLANIKEKSWDALSNVASSKVTSSGTVWSNIASISSNESLSKVTVISGSNPWAKVAGINRDGSWSKAADISSDKEWNEFPTSINGDRSWSEAADISSDRAWSEAADISSDRAWSEATESWKEITDICSDSSWKEITDICSDSSWKEITDIRSDSSWKEITDIRIDEESSECTADDMQSDGEFELRLQSYKTQRDTKLLMADLQAINTRYTGWADSLFRSYFRSEAVPMNKTMILNNCIVSILKEGNVIIKPEYNIYYDMDDNIQVSIKSILLLLPNNLVNRYIQGMIKQMTDTPDMAAQMSRVAKNSYNILRINDPTLMRDSTYTLSGQSMTMTGKYIFSIILHGVISLPCYKNNIIGSFFENHYPDFYRLAITILLNPHMCADFIEELPVVKSLIKSTHIGGIAIRTSANLPIGLTAEIDQGIVLNLKQKGHVYLINDILHITPVNLVVGVMLSSAVAMPVYTDEVSHVENVDDQFTLAEIHSR